MYKFGSIPDGKNEEPYEYANIFARQNPHERSRLAIAPRSGHVQLLAKLAAALQEPFMLLYVLVTPRGEGDPGRYESKYSFTMEQLREFLKSFADFLERDGRQNLWIRPTSEDALLVYDRHNIIYAYGPLERFIPILEFDGLVESAELSLPFPHVHHYHEEFDADAERILRSEEWIASPLRTPDENPD